MSSPPIPEALRPERQPDFAIGPLFVVGLVVLSTAKSRASRRAAALGLLALEFGWPTYQRFKRRPNVPRLLAYSCKESQTGDGNTVDNTVPLTDGRGAR